MDRADVMLSTHPFPGAFEAAVLQGSPVGGNEVRDEKCVGVAPVPRSVAFTGPVQAPGAQMAMRAKNVSPPGAVPDRDPLTRSGMSAFGAANLIGSKMPPGRGRP